MPYNLLLLPLLGGYAFINIFYPTRYYALRSDGYRLLFHSALAGLISLLFSEFFVLTLASPLAFVNTWWAGHIPYEHSGTALLSLLLGFVSWPLNFIRGKQPVLDRVLREKGDPLELMFQRAMYETKPVSLSLKSGKVYIGFVTYTIFTINPAFPIRSVKIFPLISGYREKENLRVHFTTDYSHAYRGLQKSGSQPDYNLADDFEIVIPTAEIQTANIFNPAAYTYFRALA